MCFTIVANHLLDITCSKDCNICLESLARDLVQLQCQHIFHRECLVQWLGEERHKPCPICKQLCYTPRNRDMRVAPTNFLAEINQLSDQVQALLLEIDVLKENEDKSWQLSRMVRTLWNYNEELEELKHNPYGYTTKSRLQVIRWYIDPIRNDIGNIATKVEYEAHGDKRRLAAIRAIESVKTNKDYYHNLIVTSLREAHEYDSNDDRFDSCSSDGDNSKRKDMDYVE